MNPRSNLISKKKQALVITSDMIMYCLNLKDNYDLFTLFYNFFYFHVNMTQIQYMMMVTNVHADYGYIKKPQEAIDTSKHRRLIHNLLTHAGLILVHRRQHRLSIGSISSVCWDAVKHRC